MNLQITNAKEEKEWQVLPQVKKKKSSGPAIRIAD